MAKKAKTDGKKWLWILSYPASGRTKLKVMLGAYAHKTHGVPLEKALIGSKKLGISFSHSIARDPVFPYFILYRDLEELIPSAHKQRQRDGEKPVSDAALRQDIIETWDEFEAWDAPCSALTYDDLIKHPAEVLKAVLRQAPHVSTIDEGAVLFAVYFSSLENMRRLEDADFFKSQSMKPINGIRKVRR